MPWEILVQLLGQVSEDRPDALGASIAEAFTAAGGRDGVLYLVDYGQIQLVPVPSAGTDGRIPPLPSLLAPIPVAGTLAGRAFQLQEVVVGGGDEHGQAVWIPVRDRSERIGVFGVTFAAPDDELLAACGDAGQQIGHLVHSARRYTDLVERARRDQTMALTAEMQWDMLVPPLAFAAAGVELAGLLEPAYAVAGDAFDYALNGEYLDFAILDAMGHGLTSALASVLALSTLRFARRRYLNLPEIAARIDAMLREQFDGDVFVTGQLARLDVASGELTVLNGGHPDPLLIRAGRVVSSLHVEPSFPFGLGISGLELGHWKLEPGDAVIFYSDGVIEARDADGTEFGVDRVRSLVEANQSDDLPVAELLRRLITQVVTHRGGTLADDATLLYVRWTPLTETKSPADTPER